MFNGRDTARNVRVLRHINYAFGIVLRLRRMNGQWTKQMLYAIMCDVSAHAHTQSVRTLCTCLFNVIDNQSATEFMLLAPHSECIMHTCTRSINAITPILLCLSKRSARRAFKWCVSFCMEHTPPPRYWFNPIRVHPQSIGILKRSRAHKS